MSGTLYDGCRGRHLQNTSCVSSTVSPNNAALGFSGRPLRPGQKSWTPMATGETPGLSRWPRGIPHYGHQRRISLMSTPTLYQVAGLEIRKAISAYLDFAKESTNLAAVKEAHLKDDR